MKFEDALKAMREGKKVTLYDNNYYIEEDDIRMSWDAGEKECHALLDSCEILSEDWKVVEE